MNSPDSVPAQARVLLRCWQDEGEKRNCADDLLLFFYRLRDRAVIIENHSTLIQGKSFRPLQALIYDLESRPDETMEDESQSRVIQTILSDLVAGRIVVSMQER